MILKCEDRDFTRDRVTKYCFREDVVDHGELQSWEEDDVDGGILKDKTHQTSQRAKPISAL